jgi:DNA-binding transcriptional LysR family regulator
MFNKLKNVDFKKFKTLLDIVKYKSVNEAIKRTKADRTKIYYDIKNIEKHVGESVILKNRKDVVLTPIGREVVELASEIVETISDQEIKLFNKKINADLSICFSGCCSGQFSHYFLSYVIEKHNQEYPDALITISLLNSNYKPSVFEYDILIDDEKEPEDNIEQNLINTFTYGYYASTKYLDKHGIPNNLDDLDDHVFIQYSKEASLIKKFNTIITSDSYFNINELVLEGIGIGSLNNQEILNNKKYSSLVHLLPNTLVSTVDINLKYLATSSKKSIITNVLRHCKESINKTWRLVN